MEDSGYRVWLCFSEARAQKRENAVDHSEDVGRAGIKAGFILAGVTKDGYGSCPECIKPFYVYISSSWDTEQAGCPPWPT